MGICSDGLDNDVDGWMDSMDADCDSSTNVSSNPSSSMGICSDSIDNDTDGWMDSMDADCDTMNNSPSSAGSPF